MKILETRLYQYIDLLILRYPQLIVVKDCIVEAYQILEESYTNDGKLLVAG
ncbi:phosphoheptose isomerase, partial [Bacteroides ovatus]